MQQPTIIGKSNADIAANMMTLVMKINEQWSCKMLWPHWQQGLAARESGLHTMLSVCHRRNSQTLRIHVYSSHITVTMAFHLLRLMYLCMWYIVAMVHVKLLYIWHVYDLYGIYVHGIFKAHYKCVLLLLLITWLTWQAFKECRSWCLNTYCYWSLIYCVTVVIN